MDGVGLWVRPVVLVAGVGRLILSTSARYGQPHAEFRKLIDTRRLTIVRVAGSWHLRSWQAISLA